VLIVVKLVLVPVLIAAVTLGARRWGPRVGGLLTAMPVVTGPTLCFYAVDQGARFASRASAGTLFGLAGVLGFCVVYAHTALRGRWFQALLAGWGAFLLVTLLFWRVPANAAVGLVVIVTLCIAARRALPPLQSLDEPLPHPAWDLPLRMCAAASLVLLLTSAAGWLGPQLSGLLTPFPLATAIIAAFTHAQRGGRAAVSFFHGFVPALTTFAVFCFVLSTTLPHLPMAAAIGSALAAQLALQAIVLWRLHSNAQCSMPNAR
jgi:hypothetical protein